jgi:hypothetical protein
MSHIRSRLGLNNLTSVEMNPMNLIDLLKTEGIGLVTRTTIGKIMGEMIMMAMIGMPIISLRERRSTEG